ncbi:MAG: hypothetical protein XD75_0354, partial [Parcubacteria bacterium 33_209]
AGGQLHRCCAGSGLAGDGLARYPARGGRGRVKEMVSNTARYIFLLLKDIHKPKKEIYLIKS